MPTADDLAKQAAACIRVRMSLFPVQTQGARKQSVTFMAGIGCPPGPDQERNARACLPCSTWAQAGGPR